MPSIVTYAACLASFLLLDGGWLALVGPRLYKREIGALLAEKPRLLPAAIFYLLFPAGLVWFAVLPNVNRGWPSVLINGALLGLTAYGTYDLTCAATMKTWSAKVTVADMVWGAVACGLASTAGLASLRHFAGSAAQG